ncbi:HesA/MoeB/ThiF family protein [Enterococcus sp. AZ109]|uniref:HesA/MoeB/ThiF family protein n=1 Tax=Enterococcus sp. AZ109 TaxID=2774634 RepID=UPI003F205A55
MGRYNRQIKVAKIGAHGQQKIQAASVMIVGCGALGTYSAEQLVRTGIKKIFLIDPDTVEESNLQRQALFTTKDAQQNRPKVEAAKEHLQAIDPTAKVIPIKAYFDQTLMENFEAIDLVLDCTDNFQARQAINEYCHFRKLPFIFSACAGTSGQVMAFHPAKGPCLSCAFPQIEDKTNECETIGVITPLIPFITSVQVTLTMKILTDDTFSDWQTMHVLELWPLAVHSFKITKQPACRCCSLKKDQSIDLKIQKICGDNVFQITNLRVLDWNQLVATCQQYNWQFRQNPLAIKLTRDTQEITGFKSGRFTFYGFQSSKEVENTVNNLFI